MKHLIPVKLREGEFALSDTLSLLVSFEPDNDQGPPWIEHDGHGVVSKWERRKKAPGEIILTEDMGAKLFYDFGASLRIAYKDKWGLCADAKQKLREKLGREPTRGDIAAQAVFNDVEYLRGYASGAWSYVVICVKLTRDGETISEDYLGGVETGGGYVEEQAAEMACALVAAYEKEETEVEYWASRDVETGGTK